MGNNSNLTCVNVPMMAVWDESNPKDMLMINWAIRGWEQEQLKRHGNLFFLFCVPSSNKVPMQELSPPVYRNFLEHGPNDHICD